MKRNLFLATTLLCVACSSPLTPEPETTQSGIKVNVNINGWNKIVSRAIDDSMYPVHMLFTQAGETEVVKPLIFANGASSYEAELEPGNYDLFVACGLQSDLMPSQINQALAIQPGANFATTYVSDITVSKGAQTALNITADRQNAWLEFELSNVPASVSSVTLYLKGLHDIFSLDNGWKSSTTAADQYTEVKLTKNDTDATLYQADAYIFPSANRSGMTYIIEVTNSDKTTDLYTYTSTKPILPGVHMKQSLAFANMTIVSADMSVGGWTDSEDEGEISTTFQFAAGEQYFNRPATVVNNSNSMLTIFPHEPMAVTLDQITQWQDLNNIEYDAPDELSNVTRWSMPNSVNLNVIKFNNVLRKIGIDGLNRQIKASGHTQIDADATNIIAYYDEATNTLYRYDFKNIDILPVTAAPTTEFLFYPFGHITIK